MSNSVLELGITHPGIDGIDQIEAHVQDRTFGRVQDFHIVRAGQGLILQGRTCTYYAKQLAQEAVRAVSELPILANEIAVRAPALDGKVSVCS